MGRPRRRNKRQRQKVDPKAEQDLSKGSVPPSKKQELDVPLQSVKGVAIKKDVCLNASSSVLSSCDVNVEKSQRAETTQEMDVENPNLRVVVCKKFTNPSHNNTLLNAATDLSEAIKKLSRAIPSRVRTEKAPKLATLEK